MPADTARDQLLDTVDPKDMPGLKADRTTAEVLADIVGENPAKHSVTDAERKHRLEEAAKARAAEDAAFFNEPEDPADGDAQGDYDEGGEVVESVALDEQGSRRDP